MLGWRKGGNFLERKIASTSTKRMTMRLPVKRRKTSSAKRGARIRQ